MIRRLHKAILVCLLTVPLNLSAQSEMRVIHLRSLSGEPARLKFEIAGEVITPQKPFVAGKDWLRELTWGIENSSDKPIICVAINLDFHGLSNPEAERVYKFQYGLRPGEEGTVGERKLIKPGETATFNLSEAEYAELMGFVERKQPNEGVGVVMSVVEMKVAEVYFEDQSEWKDGKTFRSEPAVAQSSGQAKGRVIRMCDGCPG